MNSPQWTLGIIAGTTVFLGLLVAKIPKVGRRTTAFLTSISTGLLIFIMVEIMAEVVEGLETLFSTSGEGYSTLKDGLTLSGALLGGLSIGLLGMALFELYAIKGGKDKPGAAHQSMRRLAMMIAVGIGIHNFTEGLAIAQAYGWGQDRLALFLAVGFGLHNATEGFGMAAPIAGAGASWGFLALLGLVGGGPTLAGIWIGSFWQSHFVKTFSFGLASGAILYIVGELLHIGRQLKGELVVEVGLLVGFSLGFATEMLLAAYG